MTAVAWIIAGSIAAALAVGLGVWWHMRRRLSTVLHQLEGSEQSRFALEIHAETVDARLEAMSQVLAAQQQALAVAHVVRHAVGTGIPSASEEGPVTQSATTWPDTQPYMTDDGWHPSTVPSALMR